MNARRLALTLIAAAVMTIAFIWLAGEPPLATVTDAQGMVERDLRGAEERWRRAQLGDTLAMGDALRTGAQSRARIAMSEGSVLDVAPDTVVRLLSDAPKRERFRVLSGSAELQAGDTDLMFATTAGSVRVVRGGRVRVREEGGNSWVRVDFGRAELGPAEAAQTLEAGEEVQVSAPALARTVDSAARALPSSAPEPEPKPEALDRETEPAKTSEEQAPAKQEHAESARVTHDAHGVRATIQGRAVRVQRAGERAASNLAAGEHVLPLGARVTVDAQSTLELEQARGGRLVTSGRAELVVGDGREAATRIVRGKLHAKAGKVPVELVVPGGRLLLLVDESGAGAGSVQVDRRETQVHVERGAITLDGRASAAQRLQAGAEGRLSAGGQTALAYEPPDRRDMLLIAGTSTTVHDPNPPTAIAVGAEGLCGRARVVLEQQLGRGAFQERARAQAAPLAWFPQGSTAYRVRCEEPNGTPGKVVASGRVSVQRDAATRQVTRVAPELEVELDGRKYNAVYQTLLPRIRVRASKLAPGAKTTLRIDSPGDKSRSLPLTSAGLTLASGELSEGTHELRAAGAEKPTLLSIRFDNALPAAYLEGTDRSAARSENTVLFSGGALEGSELSLDGRPVKLDRASRFEARATPAQGARGAALWIKHPRLGSHHYVRRLRGRDESP